MPIALILGWLAKIPALITGINIPSLLAGVGTAIAALITNIRTYWKAWLIGLLIFLQAGTAYGWYHDHSLLLKEKAAHAADNAKFVAAQAAANKQAQAEKQQLQTESKAAKNEADTNYKSLLAQYDASLLRYAAHPGGPVQTGNNQLSTTQSSDGPGQSPQLPATLTIPGSDAQICAENTARLQAAHDWAIQQLAVEKKDNEASNP